MQIDAVRRIAKGRLKPYDSLPLLELLETHLLAAGAILFQAFNQRTRMLLDTTTDIGDRTYRFITTQEGFEMPKAELMPWGQLSARLSDRNMAILILKIREVLLSGKT